MLASSFSERVGNMVAIFLGIFLTIAKHVKNSSILTSVQHSVLVDVHFSHDLFENFGAVFFTSNGIKQSKNFIFGIISYSCEIALEWVGKFKERESKDITSKSNCCEDSITETKSDVVINDIILSSSAIRV